MLNKTFVSRDKEIWKKLYTSLVRPHLEYAASVWNPNRAKDIKLIEKVQERASRIPTELRDMNYENRLKEWNITRLKDRRVRGGEIQLYKCINELEEISRFAGPKFALNPYGESAFRECKGKNNCALVKEAFPAKIANDFCHFVNVRREFFTNSITEHWNQLPNKVVEASTLDKFKARHDEFKGDCCYSSNELR